MNKRYLIAIILSLFAVFSAEVYEYAKVLRLGEVSAVTVGVPNPGHAWSTMECSSDTLCIDTSSKYVGIGTNTPAAKLDVNGGVKIGSQTTCTSAQEGTLRYSPIIGLQLCYNSAWQTVYNVCPAGATCSISGGYYIISWKKVGSYTWTVPTGVTSVDYLVVADGGAGCSGGGGAGGLRQGTSLAVMGSVGVTVGDGGYSVSNGGNSAFGTITATGGGHGGYWASGGSANSGSSGGSGGGGIGAGYVSGSGGSGVSGQGNSGGSGCCVGGTYDACGGGGGAGGAGSAGTADVPNTAGGAGLQSSISGSSVVYAAGGKGAATSPAAGAANTGNGGSGAAGGSGIVIIRYALP